MSRLARFIRRYAPVLAILFIAGVIAECFWIGGVTGIESEKGEDSPVKSARPSQAREDVDLGITKNEAVDKIYFYVHAAPVTRMVNGRTVSIWGVDGRGRQSANPELAVFMTGRPGMGNVSEIVIVTTIDESNIRWGIAVELATRLVEARAGTQAMSRDMTGVISQRFLHRGQRRYGEEPITETETLTYEKIQIRMDYVDGSLKITIVPAPA